MSLFIKEIVDLVINQKFIRYNVWDDYDKNKKYNNTIFTLDCKPYLYININGLEFINNYINILIKYNKIDRNDILKDDNNIDFNKLYEKFISSRYLLDILLQTNYLTLLNFKTIEYKDINRPTHIDINCFNNDFYKVLLTSDNINVKNKYNFINLLHIDKEVIYKDICLLAILFYNKKLSIEEFVNKYNYIKTNYKLLLYILVYLNRFGNYNLYINSKVFHNNCDVESYLIIFYNELMKYLGYEQLLFKNENYDKRLFEGVYYANKALSENIEGYYKLKILNKKLCIMDKTIYKVLHDRFKDNDNYIFYEDIIELVNKTLNLENKDLSLKGYFSPWMSSFTRGYEYIKEKDHIYDIEYHLKNIMQQSNYKIKLRHIFNQLLIDNDIDKFRKIYNKIIIKNKEFKQKFDMCFPPEEFKIYNILFDLQLTD